MGRKILIIGATGHLGEPVAVRLRQSGFVVRLMVSNIEKAAEKFGDDYEFVQGEIDDGLNLEIALNNCFGVHLNFSGEMEYTAVKSVVAAAKRVNLQRITYRSNSLVIKENTWIPKIRRKFLSELAIQESGIPYTIFCPTRFMEDLPKYIRGNRGTVFGNQHRSYHLLASDDYAKMVVASYGSEKAENKRLVIHGPEDISLHQALIRYCDALHPAIKKITVMPYWAATALVSAKNVKQLSSVIDLTTAIEKMEECGDPSEANTLLGAPSITLDAWLQQEYAMKNKYGDQQYNFATFIGS